MTQRKSCYIIKTVKEINQIQKTEVRDNEKKYYGNAVQAILDTVKEKYCVHGDDAVESIAKLLNVAIDMAFMWDLKEFNSVFNTCAEINSFLIDDNSKYAIYRKGYRFFVEKH